MLDFIPLPPRDVGSAEVDGGADTDGCKVAPFPVLLEAFVFPEGSAVSEGADEADGAKDPFLPLPFDPDDLEKAKGSVLLEGAADTEGTAVRFPPFPLPLPLPEETTVGSEEIEGDAVERALADGTRLANPRTNINTAEHQTDFMVDRTREMGETWDRK